MDALAVLSQAGGGAVGAEVPAFDAGLLLTVGGASVTACLAALIIARLFRLHRTRAAIRSTGSMSAELRAGASVVGVIEPKPHHQQQLTQQRAA